MEYEEMKDQVATQGESSLLRIVNDYITLTKPPIILLLLVTAAGGMFLAQGQSAVGGLPSLGLMALVWLGGAMASGGANALNHHYDRDIDGIMQRTRQRPVASNRISPAHALVFGVALNVAAFAILAVWVNWLAAGLTLGATCSMCWCILGGSSGPPPTT